MADPVAYALITPEDYPWAYAKDSDELDHYLMLLSRLELVEVANGRGYRLTLDGWS